MKNNIRKIIFLGLMISTLSFAAGAKLTEMEQVVLTFGELAYYFGASVPFYAALRSFDQSNSMNPAEITCKFCPERPLACGELIVKVQAKAIDKVAGAEDSVVSEIRKKMLAIYQEITKLLCMGSIDDVRSLMTKIARDETIPCEDCQKSDWQAVGVSRCEG